MDRPVRMTLLLALLGAALLLLALPALGCGGTEGTSVTNTPSSVPGTTQTTGTGETTPDSSADGTVSDTGNPDTTTSNAMGDPVTFTTEDGLALSGRLYGSGRWGVVLSHMYPADQSSWEAVAERLAQEGYLVLTYDFRGYGESEGSKDIAKIAADVLAAANYLRSAGAGDIVLVGASMGGTASLMAASTLQLMSSVRLAGVITLSAPVQFEGLSAVEVTPQLVVPLLFVAAEDDGAAGQAQQLKNLSAGKGEMQIVPGADHGTDLFAGDQADAVMDLLLGFLQQNLQVGNL